MFDLLDLVIISGVSILLVAAIEEYRIWRNREKKTLSALTYLKGMQRPSEVTVLVEGEASDSILSTTVTANKLIANAKENYSILVFTSLIYRTDIEAIGQTIGLLQTVSLLNMRIDWVNDSVSTWKATEIIALLTKLSLRCDALINSRNMDIRRLNDYDVIFHPKAGMKGSYETVAKSIRMLTDDSATITEIK